jgi:hypothetical protein
MGGDDGPDGPSTGRPRNANVKDVEKAVEEAIAKATAASLLQTTEAVNKLSAELTARLDKADEEIRKVSSDSTLRINREIEKSGHTTDEAIKKATEEQSLRITNQINDKVTELSTNADSNMKLIEANVEAAIEKNMIEMGQMMALQNNVFTGKINRDLGTLETNLTNLIRGMTASMGASTPAQAAIIIPATSAPAVVTRTITEPAVATQATVAPAVVSTEPAIPVAAIATVTTAATQPISSIPTSITTTPVPLPVIRDLASFAAHMQATGLMQVFPGIQDVPVSASAAVPTVPAGAASVTQPEAPVQFLNDEPEAPRLQDDNRSMRSVFQPVGSSTVVGQPTQTPPAMHLNQTFNTFGTISPADLTRPVNEFAMPELRTHAQIAAPKKPTFTVDDDALTFLTKLGHYSTEIQASPGFILDRIIPSCFDGLALEWYNAYRPYWNTLGDFLTAFKSAYCNVADIQLLTEQATTVRQASNEDPLNFVTRKNAQLLRFHPLLTEQMRINTIKGLLYPYYGDRIGQYLITNLNEFAIALTTIRATRVASQTYTSPLNFSNDSNRPQKVAPRASYHPVESEKKKERSSVDVPAVIPKHLQPKVQFQKIVHTSDNRRTYPTPQPASKTYPAKSAFRAPNTNVAKTTPANVAQTKAPINAQKRAPIDKSKITCFACGKTGHFLRDCPSTDRKQKAIKEVLLMQFGDFEPTETDVEVDPDFDPEAIAECHTMEEAEGLDPFETEENEEVTVGCDYYSENC